MTLEQKIGQLMIVGWQSDDENKIIELIKKYHFGNIILFTRNIKSKSQLKDLCSKIQEAALKYNGVEAFIGIDQEGGSVRRIYDGVTAVPGLMAIGAASTNKPDSAQLVGSIIGEELKEIGINLNFSPVTDINTDPQNPVIAIRAFGDNPREVACLAQGYAKSIQKHKVMACYKHFIGHGDVNIDSHIDLPYLNKTLEELESCELIPYKSNLPDAIMTAHILYKNIDDKFPASISKKIINGILREKLGFKGLVITDCFEMEGLCRTFSLSQAAVFAIEAGSNLITVSHTFGRQLLVLESLIKAVKEGLLSMQVIDNRVKTILDMKKKYCSKVDDEIDSEQNAKVALEVSQNSITLVSGELFNFDNDTVVVGVTNYVNSVAEDVNVEKLDIAKILGEKYNLNYRSIEGKNFNINDILNFTKNKTVILALSDAHLTLVQKVLYSSIKQHGNRIMLISLRTPYDILTLEKPQCHICTFEYTSMAIKSLINVLDKKVTPKGVMPVTLDKVNNETINCHLLDSIVKYIRENYDKDISLDQLSDQFLITPSYISKMFRRNLNCKYIDFVNQIRLENAIRYLNATPLKVYEIASLCGYKDMNYFTRIFKNKVGVTPTYYRNNQKYYDNN